MGIAIKTSFALLVGIPMACFGQSHDVLCREGNGSFQTQFRTGVEVSVGPLKQGSFTSRTCQAQLRWGRQSLVVASGISQVDIDLLGTELDRGEPVVAFAEAPDPICCMTYEIYSLDSPPRLLRTITGGGYFRASDTDLDGNVEIWTEDTYALGDFEGISAGEIGHLPTLVLRFSHGRLLDASHEFQPFFDDVIRRIRAEADPESLQAFKVSDGRLKVNTGLGVEQSLRLHQLRIAKIQVLEIVWAYLYSGREQEAWRVLSDMWPAADLARIEGEIKNARARGIRSQADGISSEPPRKKRRVPIYNQPEVKPAQAILMRIYPPSESLDPGLKKRELHLELVIDSAGKVRAVKPLGVSPRFAGMVIDSQGVVQGAPTVQATEDLGLLVKVSVADWKFVPAFKNDRAVASRMHFSIWLQR